MIEFKIQVPESTYAVVTVNELRDAIKKQFALAPSSSAATQSFAYTIHRVELWLIPDKNDTAFGELTVQFVSFPGAGDGVLRQVKGYGSRDISPRIGFQYPRALQEFPVQEGVTWTWLRVKHDNKDLGDMAALVRADITLLLFEGDVSSDAKGSE